MYDPVAAVMLSPDRVMTDPTQVDDYNLFAYAWHNPLKYTDPTGWDEDGPTGGWFDVNGTPQWFDDGNLAKELGYLPYLGTWWIDKDGNTWELGNNGQKTRLLAEVVIDTQRPGNPSLKVGLPGEFGNNGNGNGSNQANTGIIVVPVNIPWQAVLTEAAVVVSRVASIGSLILIRGSEREKTEEEKNNRKIYVTYTKQGAGGRVYVGRTSGKGDPTSIVRARDRKHHIRGFGPAIVDRTSFSYDAIRGREQQLIDFFGGVGNPKVANAIRAVSPWNPNGIFYHQASNAVFGNLVPYTGVYKFW